MNKKYFYLLGFAVIVGAIVYLMTTSLQSSLQYYVTVNEALAAKSDLNDKVIKIAGLAKDIERLEEDGRSLYKFKVVENDNTIAVVYKGFVPDTFKDGSNVVITGSLASNGEFVATHILAQCASKYEAKMTETGAK